MRISYRVKHHMRCGTLSALFLCLLPGTDRALAYQQKEAVHPPPNRAGNKFINPYQPRTKHGFLHYFKMRYFSGEKYADYQSNADKVPTVTTDLDRVNTPDRDLQVTWIGHATVLIQYRGVNILTDPMFSDRASPVQFAGPKRFHPPSIRLDDLPEIDFVLLSHNHYDHLDRHSITGINSSPTFLVPLCLKKWFIDAGIDENRIIELDWWQSEQFGPATFTATPSQHWSARTFWDRRKTLWASWMMQIGDMTVWYSGDSGYNGVQFKEIGKRFPNIDLALISIGAYEPRWFMKEMHMNPAEAVQIHTEIAARQSFGIHWGTFQLTAEPIDDPPKKLREALLNRDIDLEAFPTMKIGETRVVPRKTNE